VTVRVNSWLSVLTIFISLFIFNLGLASDPDALANPEEIINTGDFVEGEILVGFRPGANAKAVGQVKKALKANSEKNFHQIRVRHWKLPRGLSMEKAIAILMKNPLVEFAEPNYIYSADIHPNDTQVSELWGMHNVGQTGGVADADIDAVEAWDKWTDATSVVVGIIDTGIDPAHLYIAYNICYNLG
jgi:serine protease